MKTLWRPALAGLWTGMAISTVICLATGRVVPGWYVLAVILGPFVWLVAGEIAAHIQERREATRRERTLRQLQVLRDRRVNLQREGRVARDGGRVR